MRMQIKLSRFDRWSIDRANRKTYRAVCNEPERWAQVHLKQYREVGKIHRRMVKFARAQYREACRRNKWENSVAGRKFIADTKSNYGRYYWADKINAAWEQQEESRKKIIYRLICLAVTLAPITPFIFVFSGQDLFFSLLIWICSSFFYIPIIHGIHEYYRGKIDRDRRSINKHFGPGERISYGESGSEMDKWESGHRTWRQQCS